jgi:thiol-disulfide isomerase/thioredoxin/outer membrane lipoprotein-sorting protein
MQDHLRAASRWPRFRTAWLVLFVLSLFSAPLWSQDASNSTAPSDGHPDALTFLKEVGERYAHASTYRIEATREEQMDSELNRNWTKSFLTSIVAPGNKYRFEARDHLEWWILISDGKTQWLYQPPTGEFQKEVTPIPSPGRLNSSDSNRFLGLMDAQDTIENLSALPYSAKSAAYLPDEILSLNREQVPCYVIQAQGKYRPGWATGTISTFTAWVDKEHHSVRKLQEYMEGNLRPTDPLERQVHNTITFYQRVDLDGQAFTSSLFEFMPPQTARLVTEFAGPSRRHQDTAQIGHPAPDVSLNSAEGEVISLKSFRGRPVLLDFWATWCGPCVKSLPSIARLYKEAAKYGLIMFSIDEDNEARDAKEFLSKSGESWPNFHDDGEIVRLFPNQGIPHFVLIDADGMIVYSRSSFDEKGLRAAIVKLGPQFAQLASE